MTSRSPIHVRDPFPTTADPEAYVPRTATEAVLVRLEMALRSGVPAVVLGGPAGAGKTLLVHVLAERLDGDFHVVYAPYPKLSPSEFCHWALAALNERPADDPERALAARIARDAASGFPPLLLTIDDAGCLPPETLRMLLALRGELEGHLRLLFVRSGDFRIAELERGGVDALDVELEGSMQPAETARYVRARLDRARADARSRARFEAALEQLHARSSGNPGRLHAIAAELLLAPAPETGAGRQVTH